MWLVLLCFHLVGLVGFNLVIRKSVLGKADRFTLATIAQTGIAIPAVVLLLARPPDLSRYSAADFCYLAATIVLTIALQTVNVKALQYLEASVFSVLYNTRILIATVLGILFLHESFVGLRVLGGVMVLLAILIVKQRGSHVVMTKGMGWGLTAAFVLSFLSLGEKLLIKDVGFFNYFALESIISSALMWAYFAASKREFDRRTLLRPAMLQLMTLRAVSAYGFTGALATGALLSVANYISGMSVIFTVLLGAMWLGERDYLQRKIMATIIAVLGLTLVLLSHI
jgi:drug/metabolite transporter (DMT)-like permease